MAAADTKVGEPKEAEFSTNTGRRKDGRYSFKDNNENERVGIEAEASPVNRGGLLFCHMPRRYRPHRADASLDF